MLKESMEVSRYDTNRMLDCLKECGVKGIFFCTTNFTENVLEVIPHLVNAQSKRCLSSSETMPDSRCTSV